VPPKIVSDAAVSVEPGTQVPCSATGTPPIYIALIWNFTVVMNTTNIASSQLYQEGNYTCVATSKYGTDVKRFVIKRGERIGYFETKSMQRVAKGWVGGGSVEYLICITRNFVSNSASQIIFSPITHHLKRSNGGANFIFSTLTTWLKTEPCRFNHRNLLGNSFNILL